MIQKSASDILRTKVPIEYSDELFQFSKNLPPAMGDRFATLLAKLVPAIYYADRIDNADWLPTDEVPQSRIPLLLYYEVGLPMSTGYYDGEGYRNMYHTSIPEPWLYRYIQLPIQ